MKKTISLVLAVVLCLSLVACGGVDERYTPLIECLENHDYEGAMGYVMMLRQEAIDNGDIVIVEPQEEDYELVNRYQRVAYFLVNYTPEGYSSLWVEEMDESIEGVEALAYAYNELMALEGVDQWLNSEYFSFEEGFPTDRAALLARFTNIGLKPLYANRTSKDNMGNENTNDNKVFYYDENGTLTMEYKNSSAANQVWEEFYNNSGYYRYTYDESGKVIETKITDRENTSVYAVVTPTYDANGYLVSETIVDNYGEYVFNYTNDANGNRIQMDYINDWDNYSVYYTYDEAGKLIQKDKCRNSTLNDAPYVDTQTTTVYTYDEAGNCTALTSNYEDNDFRWENGGYVFYVYAQSTKTASYTYDVDGNLMQEVWNYGETVYYNGDTDKPSTISATVDYIYGDYYIFN